MLVIFARIVLKNNDMKRSYLKNDKSLSARKISLGDLFDEFQNIDSVIKKRISETSFHNMPLVKSLFHVVLGLDIGEIKELKTFVEKRHDFVHRGGKNGEGKPVTTNAKEIRELSKLVRELCQKISVDLEGRKLIEPAPF